MNTINKLIPKNNEFDISYVLLSITLKIHLYISNDNDAEIRNINKHHIANTIILKKFILLKFKKK